MAYMTDWSRNTSCRAKCLLQAAAGHWVSLCVYSVLGWLTMYQVGLLYLSCSQYSRTICWRGWDGNACLGVRNTSGMGLRERPLMTFDNFWRFLTYLPTLFNPKTSDFLGHTLKSDVINGHSLSITPLIGDHRWYCCIFSFTNKQMHTIIICC